MKGGKLRLTDLFGENDWFCFPVDNVMDRLRSTLSTRLLSEVTSLIYSRPDTAKLAHIAHSPRMALHFDSDGRGGNIVVFTGVATIDEAAKAVNEVPAYVTKYAERLDQMGSSPEKMAREYMVALRVQLTRVRGH